MTLYEKILKLQFEENIKVNEFLEITGFSKGMYYDIKGGKKTSLKPVQLKKLVESFPNSASIWSLKNSIYNNTKDETVLSGNLTDEHKRIISDAFLLHEKEVREIPIVSKFIKSERLDAENGIMREIKCLKKLR